jgi:hypothetical protein
MGPRCGPGTSGTLLHRRAARQPRMPGRPRRSFRARVDAPTPASRGRRRGAITCPASRCSRADSGSQTDGAPVAVRIARSRKAPPATWPRFGTRTRGSQSGADPRGRDPTRAGRRIQDPTSRASRREQRSAAGLEQGMTVGAGGGRGQRRGSFIGGRSPKAPRALAASPAAKRGRAHRHSSVGARRPRAGLRAFPPNRSRERAKRQNRIVTSAV